MFLPCFHVDSIGVRKDRLLSESRRDLDSQRDPGGQMTVSSISAGQAKATGADDSEQGKVIRKFGGRLGALMVRQMTETNN